MADDKLKIRAREVARRIHEQCWDPDWETFNDEQCAQLVAAFAAELVLEEHQLICSFCCLKDTEKWCEHGRDLALLRTPQKEVR